MKSKPFTIREKERFYMHACEYYGSKPDPEFQMCIKSNSNVYRPHTRLSKSDILPICEVLLLDSTGDVGQNFLASEAKSGGRSHFSSPDDKSVVSQPIVKVYLRKCHIGSNGMKVISEVLKYNDQIQVLDLAHNSIDCIAAEHLGRALLKNSSLQILDLHGNSLGLDGALKLCEFLQAGNHAVKKLYLSNNGCTFTGVHRIFHAVKECNTKRKKDEDLLEVDIEGNFVVEEVANSITHGVGLLIAVAGSVVLMNKAAYLSAVHVGASLVYCIGLCLVYLTSTLFHSFFLMGNTKRVFQRFDHAAIFTLIAGTYTPLLLLNFAKMWWSMPLCVTEWVLAAIGITIALSKPTWGWNAQYTIYITMGFLALPALPSMFELMPFMGAFLVAFGGLLYTIGLWFFGKGEDVPFMHVIWHLFVLAASACHYFAIYSYSVI